METTLLKKRCFHLMVVIATFAEKILVIPTITFSLT